MQPKPMVLLVVLRTIALAAFAAFFAFSSTAQQSPTLQAADRLTQPIDESNLVTLKGNTHPLARHEYDNGPAPAGLALNRMLLVLTRSAEQETALEALLDQQQDKTSPNYHAWLTPEQFGQQFGPSDQDIQTVTSWLQSHGFAVARISKGRTVIEFSGNAAQLQQTFHTEIHKYTVNGEDHWANASDPQIPAALAPVVAGIKTLHNFYKTSQILITGDKFKAKITPGAPPQFTSSTGLHALAPGDYATIYNISPLYAASINGTGTTIAVVGRSDFSTQDVIDFRNAFGLPPSTPQVIVNGEDPGVLSEGEEFEATLDATWSGAVAPNAEIIFVVSASTNTTDGLDLSEQYIIDNDLGNVMTESFGGCEAGATTAEAQSISSLAQQAAAEGITYMVSTGDSGAEGCDNPNTETIAAGPISVNVLASSPYTVGVGGTEFNDAANPTKYWNTTNSGSLSSAISYIPENVWNESCVSGCGQNGSGAIWAGGGGQSIIFNKPSWQSGVIPTDTHRDLPDVSLTAAGHDPYLLCFNGSCQQGEFYGVSGTSASAPSFAGIMALVNQKTGSKQGQANYVLYRLAAQGTLSKCNASSTTTPPTSTCIFNDVTVGNNAVPGEVGYGAATADFQSAVGYDRATGLGSVNVANLVNGWNTARSVASTTSLTITPTTVTHGTPLDVSIGVGATPPATGGPTGDVALIGDYGASPSGETEVVNLTLSNGAASSSVNSLPGGTYNVQAHYEGDGTFGPSDSTATKVTINPEASTETAAALTGVPPNLTPFSTQTYGNYTYLRAVVSGKSGVGTPTGTVTFTDSVQGSLASVTLDNTGTATTQNEAFTITGGSHSVTASYSGDRNFTAVTSSAVTFKLTPAATTTTVQAPQGSLVIGSGNAATLTVNVDANGGGLPPTGTLTLFSGPTQVGTPVSISPGISGGAVVGSIGFVNLSMFPPGQSTITVTYSGDSNYLPSTSAPITITMVRGTNIALSASASTIQAGQSITFTAKLTPVQTGGPAITGTVQFQVNDSNAGSPVPVSNSQTQFTTSSLPAGAPVIVATYSGDANYGTAETGIGVTVNPLPTTTSVATSSASINLGQSVTLTAQVTPVHSGGPAPTGSVEFWYTLTSGGGQSFLGPATLLNGQAQITTSALPIGSLTVGANYGGDNTYGTSSGSTSETVTAATFLLTDNSPSVSVSSPGQSGSTMLTFTGQNGFSGSANLSGASCSGLPSESSCNFTPGAVSLSAQSATQNVTLTINTTAPSSAFPSSRRFSPGNRRTPAELILLCVLCLSLVLLMPHGRRNRATAILAIVLLASIATAMSCGGGGGSTGPPPPPPNPGTPIGNYTITVTVTMNNVTQTINNIALNVQ